MFNRKRIKQLERRIEKLEKEAGTINVRIGKGFSDSPPYGPYFQRVRIDDVLRAAGMTPYYEPGTAGRVKVLDT